MKPYLDLQYDHTTGIGHKMFRAGRTLCRRQWKLCSVLTTLLQPNSVHHAP